MLPILIAMSMSGDFNRLGVETFTAKQFARVGIVLTVLGYLLLLLFVATWWRWLGWI